MVSVEAPAKDRNFIDKPIPGNKRSAFVHPVVFEMPEAGLRRSSLRGGPKAKSPGACQGFSALGVDPVGIEPTTRRL